MSFSGEKVKFPSQNELGDAQGLVFGDASCRMGLIVIHEWWGMNKQMREKGANMAAAGFYVLVLDVYRGKLADTREEAGHYMGGLDWTGASYDISAGAQLLKSRGCHKVGVTGYCMGGALALVAAALCPEVAAVAPFYGIPPAKVADLSKIKIPVQAHFALKDEAYGFSSPAEFNPLREKLEAARVPLEFYTYDAGHAFTNPTNPNYDKEVNELSMTRTYTFMRQHLKPVSL